MVTSRRALAPMQGSFLEYGSGRVLEHLLSVWGKYVNHFDYPSAHCIVFMVMGMVVGLVFAIWVMFGDMCIAVIARQR